MIFNIIGELYSSLETTEKFSGGNFNPIHLQIFLSLKSVFQKKCPPFHVAEYYPDNTYIIFQFTVFLWTNKN